MRNKGKRVFLCGVMLELILVSFWGHSMLTCHLFFLKFFFLIKIGERNQAVIFFFFFFKTRCHVSIKEP